MSLAIFSLNSQAPKTPGEGPGSKGEVAPATGFSKLFSVLQSGQSPRQQAVRPAGEEAQAADDETTLAELIAPEIAVGAIANSSPKGGTTLPTVAETGKDLPPALPVADRHPGSRNGTSVPTEGSSLPVPTAAAMPGTRSGGHPAGSEADAGEGRSRGGSRQQAESRQGTLSVPVRVAAGTGETIIPEPVRQPGFSQAETGPKTPGTPLRPTEGAGEARVKDALRVGAVLDKTDEQTADIGASKRLAPLATERRSIADLRIAAPATQDAPASGTTIVQASGEQTGSLSSASVFAARLPQAAEAQDIARIVDRLTAAREAVQPAAVTMAINHDEFGELSLRFDQLRTGQLSVQLSANTPEAQTALAAAASQQGGHASAGDSSNGAQAQQQQGQNAGRGAQAERDMQSGGGQPERGDRQKQGGNTQHQDAPPSQQRPRDGVFA